MPDKKKKSLTDLTKEKVDSGETFSHLKKANFSDVGLPGYRTPFNDFGTSKYDEQTTQQYFESTYGETPAYQYQRGENQGWGDELARAVGGGIAKIPFSVIGNVASILDLEDYYNKDKEIGNAVTAWAEEMKGDIEEGTKIYKSNDNTLSSREWWMNNGKGLIDSAGGFIATGWGLGKGVQLLS